MLRHPPPGTPFCNTPPEDPYPGTPQTPLATHPGVGVPFLTSALLRLLWVPTGNHSRTYSLEGYYPSKGHL